MGCGYEFGCKTCEKRYDLGYGSYSTWMTFDTLADFDARADLKSADLAKNKRIRECLTEHEGHDYLFVNRDTCYIQGADLMADHYTEQVVYIAGYGRWPKIDLEERDEKLWAEEERRNAPPLDPAVVAAGIEADRIIAAWRSRQK